MSNHIALKPRSPSVSYLSTITTSTNGELGAFNWCTFVFPLTPLSDPSLVTNNMPFSFEWMASSTVLWAPESWAVLDTKEWGYLARYKAWLSAGEHTSHSYFMACVTY